MVGRMRSAGPCYLCRSEIYLPDSLYDAACRSSAINFYCPFGHQQHFVQGDTTETELRRERDMLKQQIARVEHERDLATREANEQTERAKKAEAASKRLKKRAAAGTCPCCSRTFANMSAHMLHEHPGWVEETGAKVVPIKDKRA